MIEQLVEFRTRLQRSGGGVGGAPAFTYGVISETGFLCPKTDDFETGSIEGCWCATHHCRADVRPSLQQFSNRCIVQRVLTIASRLDVMNRLGRAMADPTRSRILLTLLGGPAYPAALARELEMTRSNVSNHLACLRDCGIVVAVPQGRNTRYEIVDAHLVQALNSLLDTTLAVDENAPCIDPACDAPGCGTGEGNR